MVDMRICPICNSGTMGITYVKRLRDPNDHMMAQDICSKFKIGYEDLIEHLTQHEIRTVLQEVHGKQKEVLSSPDALMSKITEMVNHIDDYIENIQMDEDVKYERSMIELFLKLSEQMNKNIKLLGDFMGRTSNTTQISQNILVIEQNYEKLLGMIKDADMCPLCKTNLLTDLDQNGLLMLPEAIEQ